MPPDILVFRAPTRRMNPMISQAIVDRALEADPAAAAAEYLAEFRSDIETFVRREAVDACVMAGCYELPPNDQWDYEPGVDLAGGGQDEYAQAIAHTEIRDGRTIAVLDFLMSFKSSCSPVDVVAETSAHLKRYRRTYNRGDAYAGIWPRAQYLEPHEIEYLLTDKSKSDLYRELLPAINSGLVKLLDHPKLISQLCNLERKVARSGRDTIDHPPGGHDDLINAAAIALVMAIRRANRVPLALIDTQYNPDSPDEVQRRCDEEWEFKKTQGMFRMQEVLDRQGYHFPGDD